VALVNVVVRGNSPDAAMSGAQDLVTEIRRAGVAGRVVGPAPAAIAKIKNEFRAQFFLKSPPSRRRAIRVALETALAARPELKRRTIVDVDPVSVL
jgi:primosomal protein N'